MLVRRDHGAGRPVARHDLVVALAARRRLEFAETRLIHRDSPFESRDLATLAPTRFPFPRRFHAEPHRPHRLLRRPRRRRRPARAQDTIKIGEINSYKAQPAFLEPYKKGWELAVEEVNAAGGVLGKKLQVISRDDNGNPGDAVRVAEELVSREGVALIAGTFLSNTGLAVTDFAKQKKVFFLAAEPLTDKITWQNGNRYTFRLRPNTYMQSAMLVPEAAKLKKKRWVVVYPNYEYGQSAAATFKAMLKKLQPDVEFVARPGDAARPHRGRRRRAGARRRQARRDLQRPVRRRPVEVRARGQHARPVQGPPGREPADRRARVHRAAARRGAGRLDRHRLSVLRHPDRRAQEVLPRLLPQVQRVPEARLGGRLLDDLVDRRRHQEGEVHRHREADRRVQRPAVRRRRSARSPTARSTTSRRWAPTSARPSSKAARA